MKLFKVTELTDATGRAIPEGLYGLLVNRRNEIWIAEWKTKRELYKLKHVDYRRAENTGRMVATYV
jgi:hypothetical protein